MKNKIRIFLIDDSKSVIESVKRYFKNHALIDVVLEANDGETGYNYIVTRESEYDFIIMDLIMPEQDGFFILDKMKENKINKKIIILSSFNDPNTIRRASLYGINYYMLKPFNIENLEKRIISINEDENIKEENGSLQLSITKLLHSLGIPSHIKGYTYIRDGVHLMYENPNLIGGITKELYPEIATKYETTSSRVERAIRHAIEVSWNRGDYDLMEEIFGHSVDYDRAKPTNSEFIVTVADKLRLENMKV